MSGRNRKKFFYNNENEYDMNPRKVRGHYRTSRNKRNFLIISILLALVLSAVSLYAQKKLSDYDMVEAEMIRVVDGDTLIVFMNGREERIRLIGVDAPESVSSNEEENSVFGERASEYTKEALSPGTKVFLTFDEEREDQYGRILAYVWTDSDLQNMDALFQKQLLADGYAIAIHYEPNTMYTQILYAAMNEARLKKQGLWAEQDFCDEYSDINYY